MTEILNSLTSNSVEQIVERAKLIRAETLAKRPSRVYVTTVVAGLICTCTLLLVFATRPESQRALEATTRIERLATKLARAHTIPVGTARQITRLIDLPWYDCAQMKCGTALEARNRKARIKLKMLLGNLSRSEASARN
jgi:hypothetical protein